MNLVRSLLLTLATATTMSAASQLIFIGTYTPKDNSSRGIYAVRLDTATGALGEPVPVAETPNPTFLSLPPDGRVLYALNETDSVNGRPGGGATAYRIDAEAGTLAKLNFQPTGGISCAYISTDYSGKALVLISYHGGQVTSFPLAGDDSIGPRASFLSTAGKLGPNAGRQDAPHPHSVTFSPDNRFAYVCDLGLDRIFVYRLDAATAILTPAGEFPTAPGAGPRHSKFSADGKFFYVINELANTIVAYACDPQTGAITPKQTVSTLPEGFKGANGCAEIRLHPNGRFVYGSNRGHDSIAVFARNEADGTLTPVEIVPCGGKHPRNFALSPDGAWLVCANRDTNNLTVFKVDATTGRLTATGQTATVPQAVCVLFAG
jgi:6-phosphogluconolactonase